MPAPGSASNPHRLRLVPHLESSRSLIFDPILRQLVENGPPLRIGRFTERRGAHGGREDDGKIAFRSKVVSRGHAEVWCEPGGKVLLRDTASSSGTFLNHIRLSSPNAESRPFPLKDGDVIQLGVDYQGGTEEIYRCVKIRVELDRHVGGREAFNENAIAQLNALAGPSAAPSAVNAAAATVASATGDGQAPGTKKASITECSICISSVTVCQALFIAPCSHVFHYKCIRPLVEKRYPGFMCPMCRCYADLDADVDDDEYSVPLNPNPKPIPASVPAPALPQVQAGFGLPLQVPGAPQPIAIAGDMEDQDMDEAAAENAALGNGDMEEDEEDGHDGVDNVSDDSPPTQEEDAEDEDLLDEQEVEATAHPVVSSGLRASSAAEPQGIPMAGPSRSHPQLHDPERERLDDNATPMNHLFLSTLADTSVRRSQVVRVSNGGPGGFSGGAVLTPIPSVSSLAPSFISRAAPAAEEASPPQPGRTSGSQRKKGKRRAPISSDDVTEREREQESTRKKERERRVGDAETAADAGEDEDEDAVMVEGELGVSHKKRKRG